MNKCESCKFCKEYKIHKRILNFRPVMFDMQCKEKAYIDVTKDVAEFEEIDICEKYGCEMDWEHEECEFWESNGKEKWIPIADAIPEEMERLREEAYGEKKDPWEDKTE